MCAGILVIFGVQWVSFWVPWGGTGASFGSVLVLDKNQGALLTVVMVVVMVNAMNFVDGLDGLAGGLGFIAAAATCAFSLGLLDSSGGDVGTYPCGADRGHPHAARVWGSSRTTSSPPRYSWATRAR